MKKIIFTPYLSIIILLASCSLKDKTTNLKLAHTLPPDHPVHKAMQYFADQCDSLSGGSLQVQIYPSGQLGTEQQCVELVQIGSLAITKVSAAVMEGFAEDYKVLSLPYLFKDKNHAHEVLDGPVGNDLLLSTEDKLIRGLCFYDAGARSFYTKDKPILKPEDLDGLKIRVMKSKTSMDMIKALGGSPTPISFSELYTALQSGVVDGAENNPPSLFTSRHYEVCKHYSLDEHNSIPDILIISTHVWDKLTDKEKKWTMKAVQKSVKRQRELWGNSELQCLEKMKKAGVKIYHPDKSLFSEKVKPIYKTYSKHPAISSYIKRIKEAN